MAEVAAGPPPRRVAAPRQSPYVVSEAKNPRTLPTLRANHFPRGYGPLRRALNRRVDYSRCCVEEFHTTITYDRPVGRERPTCGWADAAKAATLCTTAQGTYLVDYTDSSKQHTSTFTYYVQVYLRAFPSVI